MTMRNPREHFSSQPDEPAPELSLDEIHRYFHGPMDERERAAIDAFAQADDAAREALDDIRQDLERERTEPELEPVVPRTRKGAAPPTPPPADSPLPPQDKADDGPRVNWVVPILTGLAFAAAVSGVAFFLGRGQGIGASRAELARRDEAIQRQSVELTSVQRRLEVAEDAYRKAQRDADAGKANADKIEALREQVDGLKAQSDRLKGERDRLLVQRTRTDSPLDAEIVQKWNLLLAYDSGVQSEKPGPAKTPDLASPRSGERSLTDLRPRFVFAATPPKAFEWRIWSMRAAQEADREVSFRTRPEKGGTVVEATKPLPPGNYAVGVRPFDPDSVDPESDRPWRAYAFRILTPEERRRAEDAKVIARRVPVAAAVDLFELERFRDAVEVLRQPNAPPRAAEAIGRLDKEIAARAKGFVLTIQPDLLKPHLEIPSSVSISLGLTQDPVKPPTTDRQRLVNLYYGAQEDESKGRGAEALKKRLEALDLAEKLGLDYEYAQVGFDLMSYYEMRGEFGKNEPYYRKIVERSRKAYREDKVEAHQVPILVAYAGNTYYGAKAATMVDRVDEARELFRESIATATERKADNLVILPLYELALLEQRQGRMDESVRVYQQAYDMLVKLGPKAEAIPGGWFEHFVNVSSNLAAGLYEAHEYERSFNVANEALKLRSQMLPRFIGNLLNIRAACAINLERYESAWNDVKDGLRIYKIAPDLAGQATLELTRGILLFKQGKIEESIPQLKKALALAKKAGDKKTERLAESALRNAMLVKVIKKPLTDADGTLPPLSIGKGFPLEELNSHVSLMLYARRFEQAAPFAQKAAALSGSSVSRALALSNLAWIEVQKTAPESIDKALARFEDALREYRTLYGTALRPDSVGAVQNQGFGSIYARYAWSLAKRDRNPESAAAVLDSGRGLGLRAANASQIALDWRELGETLRKVARANPDTLYLQYAFLDKGRSLLLASAANLPTRAYEIPLDPTSLAQALNGWDPDQAPSLDGKSDEKDRICSKTLGTRLLGALDKDGLVAPGRFKRITITGDAGFHAIPFAALTLPKGGRLIERCAVGYALSRWSLDGPETSDRKATLYSVGYSANPQDRWAPGVAQKVGRLVPGSTVRVNSQAQETRVMREMSAFDVLLFSCHGVADEKESRSSRLMLRGGGGSDGQMQVREIATKRLKAQLAFLSACRTGTGTYAGGDGLLGLAWAFQVAGCQSVVATGWDVPGNLSATLVASFFQDLVKGMPKDVCLQRAAIATMRSPGHSHPYYWAGFRLVGDARPVRF